MLSAPSIDCRRLRMTGDPRMMAAAHWAVCASTSSTPSSSRTALTRAIAAPTADRHAKSTFPAKAAPAARSARAHAATPDQWAASSRRCDLIIRHAPRPCVRLASPRRTPRRRRLQFEVRAADVDERVAAGEIRRNTSGGWPPGSRRQLWRGSRSTRPPRPDAGVLIIGADTAVIVDDEILGKPADDDDAARMLRRLSGPIHRVMTGVSLRTAERQVAIVEETLVFFRQLAEAADRLVRGERGRARQSGRLCHSGAGVAVHPANRGVVFERRRSADRGRESIGACIA